MEPSGQVAIATGAACGIDKAIAPGPHDTGMLRDAWSSAARYLTGSVIRVAGGVLAAHGRKVEKCRWRTFEE